MKEKYIKQVSDQLAVSKKQRKEVVRDLNEAFASALEHGETEQQVMERFGSPKDFADNVHEQLGIDCIARQKRKKWFYITIAAVIAVMAFAISFLINAWRVSKNIIGQAETMTFIKLEGSAADILCLFALLGVVAIVAVFMLIVRYVHRK